MRISWFTLLPTLLVVFVAGCRQAPEQAQTEMAPERTMTQVNTDFDQARQQFITLANADDAQGVANLYAEDAAYIDALGNVYQGLPAIAAYFSEILPTQSDLTVETTDLWMHGDVVSGYGTFSVTTEGTEGSSTMAGMWLNVCVYEPDGSLKIQRQLVMVPAEGPAPM